jgi:hypothetical protein
MANKSVSQSINYLYRQNEMEEILLYRFYCETKFDKILEAKKLAIKYFDYMEHRLFHHI